MKQSLYVLLVFLVSLRCGTSLITKVQCSTSEKGTCREPYCHFAKNGTDSVTASYGCKELTKPLYKINVHFKVYYKMLSQYFQVGYFPKFDYCQFIQTADNNNVLYNGVKFLKKLMPESVRKCPYDNEQLQINDLLLTDDDFKVLPRGKYKVICTFSDDDDKKILRMITHVTV